MADKGGVGGGCHPDPEIRGEAVSKKIFWPFGLQFGLKIRERLGPPGPFPGSATGVAICNKAKLRRAGLLSE